ncbi:MAG: hypothetical protein AB1609_08435 [Bacillota bacterium]
MAKDAGVRLRVSGRRGPDAIDYIQTAGELLVCPVCARTRRFRIIVEPELPGESLAPGSGRAGAGPSGSE